MTFLRLVYTALTAMSLSAGAMSAAQAQSFPSKPITIVVPFTPGGAGDILARMIG
jgi:tripartite-type tricarboxylate transporter receptor subunit TctC